MKSSQALPTVSRPSKWWSLNLKIGMVSPVRALKFPKFDITPFQNHLASFCKKWGVKSIALYGSATREDFSSHSDVDLLVSFHSHADHDLFAYVDMKDELEKIFGRPVDIANRTAIEQSPNELRREEILGGARLIYDEAA